MLTTRFNIWNQVLLENIDVLCSANYIILTYIQVFFLIYSKHVGIYDTKNEHISKVVCKDTFLSKINLVTRRADEFLA